jgi:ABC-2 type transport system ATP-binding protein/lipopolysaccharide transport system ATP-binding protein
MDTMISVRDLTMRFRMVNDRIFGLKEYLVQMIRGRLKFHQFEALKHVSFDVKKGDIMGVIGDNGAGKSTLLKVISGILKPTEGSVSVYSNVVPMLELGSGFDTELSGRENIFLNGAILGYSARYLKSKFDEIVAFSELSEFLEVPLRNYSSGMIVRLAFSISTVVEPDVLIVDEILAVGDAAFQEKSKKRMHELMRDGTTVLFVSHDLSQIREMCDQVLWLERGSVKLIGETQAVCDAYQGK